MRTRQSAASLVGTLLTLSWMSLLSAADRTFTVFNDCPDTIWPAVTNYAGPAYTGERGWALAPGATTSLTLPDTWNGRMWARRWCTFDSSGAGTCVSGDSGGGITPTDYTFGNVNILEFNLDSAGLDYWDVSAVAGFNLPVSVTVDNGCTGVTCSEDLNPGCPNELMQLKNANGAIVGCLSACNAGIDAGTDSANCCSGTYDSAAMCTESAVEYASFFKAGCAGAYAYPFDNGVVLACDGTASPGYHITFCPAGPSSLIANINNATTDNAATVSFKPVSTSTAMAALATSTATTNQLDAVSDTKDGKVNIDLTKLELALMIVILLFLLVFAGMAGSWFQSWRSARRLPGGHTVHADEKQAVAAEWSKSSNGWQVKNPFLKDEEEE